MLPSFVADMNIAEPVVRFLRERGLDVVSAREQGWGNLADSEILFRAHAASRFVITHDSDFGTLAVHVPHHSAVDGAQRGAAPRVAAAAHLYFGITVLLPVAPHVGPRTGA